MKKDSPNKYIRQISFPAFSIVSQIRGQSRIGRYLFTIPKPILLITALSIISAISIQFWLKDIPEIFKYGYEFGEIIYNLSLAIIASFIFYFFVVHIEKQDDRLNLSEFISDKINSIIVSNAQIALDFCDSREDKRLFAKKDFFPSEEELERGARQVFENVDHDCIKEPEVSENQKQYEAEWYRYTEARVNSIERAISDLFVMVKYLDSELVCVLTNIKKDKFQAELYITISNIQDGLYISPYGFYKSYYRYAQTVKQLFEYAEAKKILNNKASE
jgi:hypothetical protein